MEDEETSDAWIAPPTSFANLPGFSLGMANLVLSYDGQKTGFVADMVIGPRGEDAVFLAENTGSRRLVNQLYAYWKPSDRVILTFGNFNTYLGYEVISPASNFNYSTSYAFSYGPFSHTGLKADFDLGSGFSFMLAIMDPTDFTDFNPNDSYFGGTQLGYDFGSGQVFLNTLFGEDYFEIDFTAGVDVMEDVYVGLNGAYTDDLFYGATAYLQYTLSPEFSIGGRAEYFKDDSEVGEVLGPGISATQYTLSGNYKIGGITLIPELRWDHYNSKIVSDADGSQKQDLMSFVVAAVYDF